jgi:hypothetical protein
MPTRTTAGARSPAPLATGLPRADVVTALSCYVVILFALPSRLTVAALGGAGPPVVILGLGIGAWWLLDRLHGPDRAVAVRHRVRPWALVMLGSVGVTYVVAMTRAIAPNEMTTADLSMVALFSWVSVLIASEDGIVSQDRLDTLVRRMVFMGGLVAVVGMVQFLTGQLWTDRIEIPGLVANQALGDLGSRGSFSRPSGTALHPIEFGAVLTMLLPLAINLALVDRMRSSVRRWTPVAVISLSVVLSISRSALICAAVGLVVAAYRWTPAVRRMAAAAAVALFAFVFVTIPGMLGTLTSMFTTMGTDTSTLSRVDSYSTAFAFIERSPAFGRGLGTFLPSYRILDNEYLLLLIEIGVVGTFTVVGLMAAAYRSAARAARLSQGDAVQRCQGLAAATAGGAVGLAFYDGFSFPMASSVLFLLLGLAGAQYRLVAGLREQGAAEPAREEGRQR